MKIRSSRLLIFLILILGNSLVFGQINFKAGLTIGHVNPQHTNIMLKRYNQEHTDLKKKFTPIRFLLGLDVGLRYRLEVVDFELTYRIKARKAKAKGTYPGTDRSLSREILLGINSFSFGVGVHYKSFGFGGAIDLSKLIIQGRNDSGKSKDKFPIVNKPFWGNHFYLSYELAANDNLALSIRPYLQLTGGKFNVAPLQSPLEQENTGVDMLDDFTNYGIMLIFYNGRQD